VSPVEPDIQRTLAASTPAWPDRPTPPEGAPNVVIVLCDDLGYSDLGCYGSEISTPHLDRAAAEGVRLSNFNTTPMCAPTRAALLTGLNSHAAGVGAVGCDRGFPGYRAELAEDVATAAETFRAGGYGTLMVGKWHLSKDVDSGDGWSRSSWPLQRGFDRFYGFMEGLTNYHHPPRLIRDSSFVEVDRYPDGYYVTDDLTDQAISMLRALRTSHPTRPFFLYVAHAAVHAPLQAKAEDAERYRGRYDGGWDALRAERFACQQELGIVASGTACAPRNAELGESVDPWTETSPDARAVYSRYMEVYAGMVDNVDQNFGRLRAALETMGEWDNTIVLFTSDNGASREGEEHGTVRFLESIAHLPHYGTGVDLPDPVARARDRIDLIGGPRVLAHYPRGWAMASNTPFRLYKRNVHAGGRVVPCVVSWPAGLGAHAGAIRPQYVYVTDVLPTLLEWTGVAPADERNGIAVRPMQGRSAARVFTDRDAPSVHTEQYYEIMGNRGFYRDGWEVLTRHRPLTRYSDEEWELYDLDRDPTEIVDLASERPDVTAELAAAWERAAEENQVFPLSTFSLLAWFRRESGERVLLEPLRILAGSPSVDSYRSALLVQQRSFTVRIDLDFRPGDRGVLVAHGDQGGGYLVFVDGDRLQYVHNDHGEEIGVDAGPLHPGTREVALDFQAPGSWRWDVTILADGGVRHREPGLPMFGRLCPLEGIDVGIDRRSPVSWALYEREGTFAYTGELRSVTYTPGELAPDAPASTVDELIETALRYE
jgi:arylsulfatase